MFLRQIINFWLILVLQGFIICNRLLRYYVLVFKLVTIISLTIFRAKRDDITREWTELHNEELSDLYSSPNSVRVFRSRRMRWGRGHVARVGEKEVYAEIWWGNLKEREHLEDPGVNRRIILRGIFRKWDVGTWTGSSWLGISTGGGHL